MEIGVADKMRGKEELKKMWVVQTGKWGYTVG